MQNFENGTFSYSSYYTIGGQTFPFTVTLDLNHPEIAAMLYKAWRSKGRTSTEASGALVVDTRTAKLRKAQVKRMGGAA